MWHLLVQSEKKRLGTVGKKRLGTKNVRYSRIFKQVQKTAKSCLSQKFVATILVTYVTILTGLDLSLQN